MSRRCWRLGLLVLMVATTVACTLVPAKNQHDFIAMTEEEEYLLGGEFHADIIQQYGYYDAPELQAYVQSVGEQVARRSRRDTLVYRFTVLDSSLVNAFALPGGYVYITRGLLAYLNSDAQLAAILGHEVGHVTALHAVRQVTAAQATNLDLTDALSAVLVRGYGREHELEAYRLGAEYLARAGYDPHAIIEVVAALKNKELFDKRQGVGEGRPPPAYHALFSSLPENDSRLLQLVEAAEQFKGEFSVRTTRQQFLEKLDGLVLGDSGREGIRRGNRFYHAALNLGLDFPDGWRVENRPDSVVGMPKDKAARLVMTTEAINQHLAPEEFLYARFRLDELDDERSINGTGHEGYSGVADIRTAFGVRRARVATIYYNDIAYVFVGFAQRKGLLSDYDEGFNRTISSFRELRPHERLLARALRLRLHRIQGGETMAALVAGFVNPRQAEEQLRLLNGIYPSGDPDTGQIIKVVQ